MNPEPLTALVTGASSGIGFETALALSRQGLQVLILCSSPDKTHATLDLLRSKNTGASFTGYSADLSDQQQIRLVAVQLSAVHPRIDILINNAACNFSTQTFSPDGIEMQLAVNFLAPFLLTRLLLPCLQQSGQARILNITSRAHARGHIYWDNLNLDNAYSSMAAYNQSKLALVLFTYELARQVRHTHITVNCLQPGLVNTHIGDKHAIPAHRLFWDILKQLGTSPAKAAAMISRVCTSAEFKDINGAYFSGSMQANSAPYTYDTEAARRLWMIARTLTHSEDLQP